MSNAISTPPRDEAEAERQETRSRQAADALRALLAALATAANGLTYAARGQTNSRGLWLLAAIAFGISLACVLRSWFMVKHRAIARKKKALGENVNTAFTKDNPEASWYWDKRAAWALFAGLALLAIALAFWPKV